MSGVWRMIFFKRDLLNTVNFLEQRIQVAEFCWDGMKACDALILVDWWLFGGCLVVVWWFVRLLARPIVVFVFVFVFVGLCLLVCVCWFVFVGLCWFVFVFVFVFVLVCVCLLMFERICLPFSIFSPLTIHSFIHSFIHSQPLTKSLILTPMPISISILFQSNSNPNHLIRSMTSGMISSN